MKKFVAVALSGAMALSLTACGGSKPAADTEAAATEAAEAEATEATDGMTLQHFIHIIISRLNECKHADGTIKGSFEGYEKLERRIQEFCKTKKIKYEKLLISDITPGFVHGWKNPAKVKGVSIFPRCSMRLYQKLIRMDF